MAERNIIMKNLRKMISVIFCVVISCMCLVTPVCAAGKSEAAVICNNLTDRNITTNALSYHVHKLQPYTHLTSVEFYEQNHVNTTSSCTHSGEKTVKFVGYCYCGGILYQVNCKACGAFVGGLCTDPDCTYWD